MCAGVDSTDPLLLGIVILLLCAHCNCHYIFYLILLRTHYNCHVIFDIPFLRTQCNCHDIFYILFTLIYFYVSIENMLLTYFDSIDEGTVFKAACLTKGACGPSRMRNPFRHVLTSSKCKKQSKYLKRSSSYLDKKVVIRNSGSKLS